MTIDNLVVLAVLGLLAMAVIVLGFALMRRPAANSPGADPTLLLLQQQVTRLAEQVSQIGSQVPREVGVALSAVTGQLATRLSENAQSMQKASSDTGRLIAD